MKLDNGELKNKTIREALSYSGRRTRGSEIKAYFDLHGYEWVPLTVEPWREQKDEGIVRSINLHIRDHMGDVFTEVFGNETLHTLVEEK